MNTNFKVIGLTQLGIKSESTVPEVDALTARPSELYVQTRLRNIDVDSSVLHAYAVSANTPE